MQSAHLVLGPAIDFDARRSEAQATIQPAKHAPKDGKNDPTQTEEDALDFTPDDSQVHGEQHSTERLQDYASSFVKHPSRSKSK